jgi:hypothetical protein
LCEDVFDFEDLAFALADLALLMEEAQVDQ